MTALKLTKAPFKNSVVCSKHFKNEDIYKYHSLCKLVRSAVPTQLMDLDEEEEPLVMAGEKSRLEKSYPYY